MKNPEIKTYICKYFQIVLWEWMNFFPIINKGKVAVGFWLSLAYVSEAIFWMSRQFLQTLSWAPLKRRERGLLSRKASAGQQPAQDCPSVMETPWELCAYLRHWFYDLVRSARPFTLAGFPNLSKGRWKEIFQPLKTFIVTQREKMSDQ